MFLSSVVLLLGLVTYHHLWCHRYRETHIDGENVLRLRARVLGPGDKGRRLTPADQEATILVEYGGSRLEVLMGGAVVDSWPRRALWVGDRVVLDCVTAILPREHQLYREPGQIELFDAIRVVRGHWPGGRRVRWGIWTVAAASAVLLALVLGPSRPLAPPSEGSAWRDDTEERLTAVFADGWGPGVRLPPAPTEPCPPVPNSVDGETWCDGSEDRLEKR